MHDKLYFLSDETGSNAQSADPSGVVVSNDPQLPLGRHLLDLFYKITLGSVKEVVDNDMVSELFRKDRCGNKVPGNNDTLAGRQLLNLNILSGKCFEF